MVVVVHLLCCFGKDAVSLLLNGPKAAGCNNISAILASVDVSVARGHAALTVREEDRVFSSGDCICSGSIGEISSVFML